MIERLSGLLAPGGLHLISVPFGVDETIEHLTEDLTPEERTRMLGHPEHYRAFGHVDFPEALKARFGGRFFEVDVKRMFSPEEDRRYRLGLDLPANRLFGIRA